MNIIGIHFIPTPTWGGGFSYSEALLKALLNIDNSDIILFCEGQSDYFNKHYTNVKIVDMYNFPSFKCKFLYLKVRYRLNHHLNFKLPKDINVTLYSKFYSKLWKKYNLDFLFLTSASIESVYDSEIPFVCPIHDINHRINPDFPEVSIEGEWQYREKYFSYFVKHASKILVDSETGKNDVLNNYLIDVGKIEIVRFIPSNIMNINSNKILPDKINQPYIIYPATLHAHKNHYRLIEAIYKLKKQHVHFDLVFTGNESTHMKDILYTITEIRGLNKHVHFLGFISPNLLSVLYSNAFAMVMPTFFGPTNLPVIEAFYTGCPVIGSNIQGMKEMIGEAGIFIDPWDVDSISNGIMKLYSENSLRQKLIAKGKEYINNYSEKQFEDRIKEIVYDLC